MYAMFNDGVQLTISLHLKLGQADYWLAKILKTPHPIVDNFYKRKGLLVAFFEYCALTS